MKNTLPQEIESLCVLKQGNQEIPLWPYVVAVSGHRTFAKPGEVEGLPGYERETIKNAFRKELEALARLWEKSCKDVKAPLILLTGMAEGADQLAVEVARDLSSEFGFNIKVIAILPMEKELFKTTLSEENWDTFEELLKSVHMTYSLPMKKNPGDEGYEEFIAQVTDADNPAARDFRHEQYDMLSKFLALHSHVLFVFWDGIDVSKKSPGGTSTALHYKLEGNTNEQSESDLLTYTSVGPVVQFLTPRNNDANRKEPVAKLENPEEVAVFYWSKRDLWDAKDKSYFFPSRQQMTEERRCKTTASSMKEIVDTLERIGELNWYSINCPPDVKKDLSTSKPYPFDKEYLKSIHSKPEDFCDAETEVLINHYRYLNKLARRYQDIMKGIIFWFLLGVGSFLVFGWLLSSYWEIRQNGWGETNFFSFVHYGENTLYEIFGSWTKWTPLKILALLYGISVLVFTVAYITDKLKKYRIRYYRFRAVAEALRVQIFWRIAEMSNCVSGHYRTHQLSETEWLRAAINGLDVLFESPKKENFNKTRKERMTFVREVWINGQLKYFQDKLAKGEIAHSFYQLKFLGSFLRLFKSVEQFLGFNTIAILFMLLWIFLILLAPVMSPLLKAIHAQGDYLAEFSQILYGFLLIIFPIYGLLKFWMNAQTPQSDLDRYKQMLFPFDRAILLLKPELANEDIDEQLEAADETESETKPKNKLKKMQTILCQLGTEAVSENASWYLSFGERKLTMPQ